MDRPGPRRLCRTEVSIARLDFTSNPEVQRRCRVDRGRTRPPGTGGPGRAPSLGPYPHREAAGNAPPHSMETRRPRSSRRRVRHLGPGHARQRERHRHGSRTVPGSFTHDTACRRKKRCCGFQVQRGSSVRAAGETRASSGPCIHACLSSRKRLPAMSLHRAKWPAIRIGAQAQRGEPAVASATRLSAASGQSSGRSDTSVHSPHRGGVGHASLVGRRSPCRASQRCAASQPPWVTNTRASSGAPAHQRATR